MQQTAQRRHHNWEEQIHRMIGLINIARIAILFSLLIFIAVVSNLVGIAGNQSYLPLITNMAWIKIWCIAYSVLIGVSLFRPEWQLQGQNKLPNISSVIDISMIAALVFLAGGVESGFAILVLPFLATSCLLSYGRFPLLYGSYVALLVSFDVFWHLQPFSSFVVRDNLNLLTSQIVLIAACYLVPLLTSFSAEYLASADARILRHKTAFERMSGLNHIVLNRVQEAVIVLDAQQQVWLFNDQAQQYIPYLTVGKTVEPFGSIIQKWRKQPARIFEDNCVLMYQPMHVRAVPLVQENTELLMLFIRSEQERQKEAQTVKLTSLGLLTSNLAHEIRNPLSAMRQANDLLKENNENNLPLVARLTNIIEKNIARVDKMIEDVSTLNKRDRLNPQTIDLHKFWFGFMQEFQLTRPESAGCLRVDLPKECLTAEFDIAHLQQIVWNLCNNAWRHSKKQRDSVVVSIIPDGDTIHLRVQDDGPGVAPKILEHLFEPFQTNQAEGTGLGLYVSHELAHANKGDLIYDGKNKAFELIMPRKLS
ncbi:HAMP domain-containing sensor histidine kinase [Kingella kingae]|uniref:ATP-binding protein n=1 Tax=Kingella kingae TaxID=504 RepID=UPI000403AC52|nr:HAMP domain-containing sensor histidine kinase [Kingella kingae]MDK4590813.1 HAMP domain-containing sensor histidine kinase [Kingella kingae]MDK4628963.1 HAMP domain-containing sensor histidine kinase [Kingella kingae]MDK4636856.1 HAMP domain-containing sensor histidine kinase [Kingella kingae]MDK4672481.1 HAMP domain-containing sensor histidine kinase [Kingella kingae]MDK4695661.1 HAMP domain-containing sensor histidine kinase [Kingella kingae]